MTYRRDKRPSHHASHTDDWLMTYADMITLLLCFFAIFLSVSLPKKEAQKVSAPVPVERPVKAADILEGNLPLHGVARADRLTADIDPMLTPVVRDVPKPAPAATIAAVAPPAPVQDMKPAAVPASIDKLKAQGAAHIEQKGDRITTMEISSGTFFASGSATLSDAGKNVLKDVAATIQSDRYKDYIVTVEGHTDDTPIATKQFPSNWELSAARAAAVVHFFIDQGVAPQRLRAVGYGGTYPLVPNRDAEGKPIPQNQAQNRRVVIRLEKIEKGE